MLAPGGWLALGDAHGAEIPGTRVPWSGNHAYVWTGFVGRVFGLVRTLEDGTTVGIGLDTWWRDMEAGDNLQVDLPAPSPRQLFRWN